MGTGSASKRMLLASMGWSASPLAYVGHASQYWTFLGVLGALQVLQVLYVLGALRALKDLRVLRVL